MKAFVVIVLASLLAIASARSFEFSEFEPFFNDGRIVNGEEAATGQFPHQVSLRVDGYVARHFCGGTILNSRWILTAAHCSFVNNKVWAVVGTNELQKGGKFYSIDKIIPHPGYINGKLINDIALWRTSDEIVFSDTVQPAILPSEDTFGNASLTVSGWGRDDTSTNILPNKLQYLNTESLTVAQCRKTYQHHPQIPRLVNFDELICVLRRNAGACQGDSGGPLITKDRVIVGVVSWGIPCARNYPDGFTRVYSFLKFINKIIGEQSESMPNSLATLL